VYDDVTTLAMINLRGCVQLHFDGMRARMEYIFGLNASSCRFDTYVSLFLLLFFNWNCSPCVYHNTGWEG